jgi:hypothetical protein
VGEYIAPPPPAQDSAYFQEERFTVVVAGLSAVMVEHCRAVW